MSIKIIGTGRGIPARSVTNHELESFLDTSDEWITSRTGIKSRFVCTDESLTDLAHTAATNALKKANITADNIDLILCSTINGDYITPSLACCLAERFELMCPAMDINAACAGFVHALDIAACYIETGRAKNVLVVCAEEMTKHIDWRDRSTCVLFGDGAGACVVAAGDALKFIHLSSQGNTKILNSIGSGGSSPFATNKMQPKTLHMEGQEVFRFAVGKVESEAKMALEATGLTPTEIDFYVLHQANKRIVDSARVKLKQAEEKFPVNIDRHGNTSSATIPILLDEMMEDHKIKVGTTLFLCAFGAGLTAGSCILKWE